MIDECVVVAGIEVERAHDRGYAQHVAADGEACDGGGEPKEGLQAGERRAQAPDRFPPVRPQ